MKSIRPNLKKNNAFVTVIFVFIVSGLLLQAMNLSDKVPFHDWDEAIYAQVAKEFARSPSLLLTYNGSPWFEKPPLPSLLYSISWLIPLKKELSARLVSLIFSIAILFTVYKILERLNISKSIRLIAIFVTIASSMYRDRSMLVNVDIMLTLGWLLYVLGAFQGKTFVKITGIFLGTLSKSLLGFFPLFAELFTDIVFKKLTKRKLIEYLVLLASGSLWHIYMITLYGEPFIKSHFVDHLVSRVTRPIELHFGDKWFYVSKLWGETNIFLILAILGFALLSLKIFILWKNHQSLPKNVYHYLILAVLPLTYIMLLTLSKSKLHWYITPLIPFVGIWAAACFEVLQVKKTVILKKILPFGYIAIATYSLYTFGKSVNYIQPDWYKPTDKTLIGICVGKYAAQNDKITYLVPPQERKDAQVIEAAKLQIGSSFIYGSAPAFLYYADKPVDFVYKKDNLDISLANSNIFVLDKNDMKDKSINESLDKWINSDKNSFSPLCSTDKLVAYRKSN